MEYGYRFDNVARAERYFVATLLTHFILSNDFAGLRLLFQHVFSDGACADLPDDFEVVTELDPLRDASVYNSEVKKLYREFRRVAVPDVFLRWSHLCLVLEAKFFTDPSGDELGEQIRLQQEAIAKVKPFTIYRDWNIQFALLTLNPPHSPMMTDIHLLSWESVVDMIDQSSLISNDLLYCRQKLTIAIERAKKEFATVNVTFEKLKYNELLAHLPRLIEQGKVFIGYTGGTEALAVASADSLVNRAHYKVSDVRWSQNWLTIDQFLHRIFELKGYFKEQAQGTE